MARIRPGRGQRDQPTPGSLSVGRRTGLPRTSRVIHRGLLIVVALLVALQVGVLAYHLALTLAFPYDLNYGEGYVLFDAVRFSRGEPVYVDLQLVPMVRSPYPPLD